MANQISTKRQDANKFYIGIISFFGAVYSLLDKVSSPSSHSAWQNVLCILAMCWCLVWWLTIRAYRRINIAKWTVIYELEHEFPSHPFLREKQELRDPAIRDKSESRGSFTLTKLELVIPLLVGLIFLFLATLPFLDRIAKGIGVFWS